MKFKPNSAEEIQRAQLIEPGEYDFEVIDATEEVSKAGNPMIKLRLKIYVDDSERTIFDYLMEAVEFKLRHFCEAVGILDVYEAGDLLPVHCTARAGKVLIGIRKDKSGQYPDQNTVKDYVVNEESEPVSKLSSPNFTNDEIPF